MSTALAKSGGFRITRWDRFFVALAPGWGMRRVMARARLHLAARHFEAASSGRRTSGWSRKSTDANAAASGATLGRLRAQARDLIRNNPWARRGLRRIVTDTIGWGVKPKAKGIGASRINELWKIWAETTQCDAAGRLTFYGLQRLVMRTVVESGEVIIRRRFRRPEDGLAVPMQLQVLEPDYIDTSKDGIAGVAPGSKIVQGIEIDAIGRRVAYWLFEQHPGSNQISSSISKRVPADGILHVYEQERAGQMRGPSWFASVDLRLHDFDEFEDATLMKQKVAALMAAFITDAEDGNTPLARDGGTDAKGQQIDAMEPGMILSLPPGRKVTVANPPTASDHSSFTATMLRAVAAGLGITYEDLTGDYSQVNYSSARMARNAHGSDVEVWRWDMVIPQFCAPAWAWMQDALIRAGENVGETPAEWTPAPMAMLDPAKDAEATTKRVRSGQMTHDQMIREQGYDPEEFWKEYEEGLKRLDKFGIVVDSDPRKVSTSGQLQGAQKPAAEPASEPASDSNDDENADEAAPTDTGSERKVIVSVDYLLDIVSASRADLAVERERAAALQAQVAKLEERAASQPT